MTRLPGRGVANHTGNSREVNPKLRREKIAEITSAVPAAAAADASLAQLRAWNAASTRVWPRRQPRMIHGFHVPGSRVERRKLGKG